MVFRILRLKKRSTRVLVVHLAGVGDTLMLTPALGALQRHYQDSRINLIALHDYVKEAFQGHPLLSEITLLPHYRGQWISDKFKALSDARLIFAAIWFYPDLILKHCFRDYEVGVNFALSNFDRDLGIALLYCLNVSKRVGSFGEHGGLLTHQATINYTRTHRARAYLDHLQPLGIFATNQSYEFPISDYDAESVRLTLRRVGVNGSKRIVAMHPGGRVHINSRRWPAEYYVRVGSYLAGSGLFSVVMTGDSEDQAVCEEIARGIGAGASSLAGQLSIAETGALLSRCELCITNDTATLHLADAVQVPRVISIFGPTDPKLLVPNNERHIVLRSDIPCSPCMGSIIDENSERCWREVKEECLLQVTPEEVIDVLREQYAQPAARAAIS